MFKTVKIVIETKWDEKRMQFNTHIRRKKWRIQRRYWALNNNVLLLFETLDSPEPSKLIALKGRVTLSGANFEIKPIKYSAPKIDMNSGEQAKQVEYDEHRFKTTSKNEAKKWVEHIKPALKLQIEDVCRYACHIFIFFFVFVCVCVCCARSCGIAQLRNLFYIDFHCVMST